MLDPRAVLMLAALAAPAVLRAAGRREVIVIEGRREPSEAAVATRSMVYLPFTVPPGVTGITVHKELDHGPDPAFRGTVDLGLFDPRGIAYGGAGFRGWQGGTPQDLTLTGDPHASRHYLGGPIPAGTWHLAQWFLASSPAGLGYKYTITLAFDGPAPPARMPAVEPYRPGVIDPHAGWYPGSLHNHTVHSDGAHTLEELAALNKAAGMRFVASTDHNTVRAHTEFARAAKAHPDMLLLFGEELTSPCGHANILGSTPGHWFDFRLDGGDGRLPAIIDEAHRQRAVFSINHPFSPCTTCLWRYPEREIAGADAIEVWNGPWTLDDAMAVNWWDSLLKTGRRIHALGGADYHRDSDPLTPAAWVHVPRLSQPAVMDALRRGRVTLTEKAKGMRFTLESEDGAVLPGDILRLQHGARPRFTVHAAGLHGATLRLIWADGSLTRPLASDDETLTLALPASPAPLYVRAEARRPDGAMAALANPIWLEDNR